MNMSGKAMSRLAGLSDGYGDEKFEASHSSGFIRTVVTAGANKRNVAPPPMITPPKKPMVKTVFIFINALHFAAFMVFGSPSRFREPFVLATPPKLTFVNPSSSLLMWNLSLIHISEPTRQAEISYAVFCLKKK